MPIIFRNEHVGCIEIINRTNNDEYSEDEITAIHSFAGLVALYLDENEFHYSPDTDKTVIMSLKGITKDFSHPSEKELVKFRRDFIGFIFQAYNLMPNLTAIENVRFIAEKCKNSGDPAKAIEMVGLSDRANNYPSMMSGGQQQRVSIARAIVKNPRIILADEPTAALDFSTGQEVLGLIEKLISEKLTTVVMVTHNVEIAKMANRVIRVKDGKIVSIRKNTWPMHAADIAW